MIDAEKSYELISGNGYLTIRLVGICDSSNIKAFPADVTEKIVEPFPHVIVNCEHLSDLSSDWMRALIQVQLKLKAFNKEMRFIHTHQNIILLLKRSGMDSTFKMATGLREALVSFGLASKRMLDTDFINPFLAATLRVLDVQASVKSEAGAIFLKKENDQFVGDISGVIGIVSDSFNGSVVISFPEKTFLAVMSGMLGETYTELSKDILDGAGEITNMIFGQAKIILNEKGYGIKTAIPSVVSGKDHSLNQISSGPIVVIPFKSNAGDFFVEICLSA